MLTIPFSHYNERARWAMQHHKVVAHERRYLPLLHMRAVRGVVPAGQRIADKTGSGVSTPVLVLDDGTVLTDSTRIVRWADATFATKTTTLYPASAYQDIVSFEQRLHDDLGRDTRFLAYWFLLDDHEALSTLVRDNVSWWQRMLFLVASSAAKSGMRKRLRLTQPRFEKTRARFEALVHELSAFLGEREYFFEGRFTAADLTAATMLAPVVLPLRGYGAKIPPPSPAFGALIEQVAATGLGAHARRMFERHRGAVPPGWTVS